MIRVRKVIERGDLIVLERDRTADELGVAANAMYLLDYVEYEQQEHDAAIGKAVKERAEQILRDDMTEEDADGTR